MLSNLCAETIKLLGVTTSDGCGRNASSDYHVYPVSGITSEGRVGLLGGGGGGVSNNFRPHSCIGAYCTCRARSTRWWLGVAGKGGAGGTLIWLWRASVIRAFIVFAGEGKNRSMWATRISCKGEKNNSPDSRLLAELYSYQCMNKHANISEQWSEENKIYHYLV